MVGVGEAVMVMLGVGVISSEIGLVDGTILPKRLRRNEAILLLERMTIRIKIKAKKIKISLLDVIEGL